MTKKIIDAISAVSIAILFGIAIKFAMWGESPRPPGHLSIDSKILVWDLVPVLFGFIWLLVRYANALRDKFQNVFGTWWKFAFGMCVFVIFGFLHSVDWIRALVLRISR
jgi:hypothetical protein